VAARVNLTGQMYDSESGLNYNIARDYYPTVGRYVESDPIGLRSKAYSSFAYTSSNPLSLTDPKGRDEFDPERLMPGPYNSECFKWGTPSTTCPNDNSPPYQYTTFDRFYLATLSGGMLSLSGIGVAYDIGALVFGTAESTSMCMVGTGAGVADLMVSPSTAGALMEITGDIAGYWYNQGYISAPTYASVLIGIFSGEVRSYFNEVKSLFSSTNSATPENTSPPSPQNTPTPGQ
jgi:RHS repeat-associated protein